MRLLEDWRDNMKFTTTAIHITNNRKNIDRILLHDSRLTCSYWIVRLHEWAKNEVCEGCKKDFVFKGYSEKDLNDLQCKLDFHDIEYTLFGYMRKI
jgi:hypothetical protein